MIGRPRPFLWLLTAGALAATAPALADAPDGGGAEPPPPRLTMRQRDGDPSRLIVEAAGLDPSAPGDPHAPDRPATAWHSFLVIRVIREGDHPAEETPPLLGTYGLVGKVLRFEPRFPIEPGVRYRAEFDPRGRLGARGARAGMTAEFSIGRPSRPPTATVTAIYPSRSTLPENVLRFYIHFSAPMSRGEAYRHVQLLDDRGRPIADPFLELEEELWSGDGRRFTLLLDPGRVKRGLRPREEVGPVLMAGRSYELVVDPGWNDAEGRPLRSGFLKAFRTGPADETSPDPKRWAVRPPSSETREPLEIRFPEPLDRALLDRLIAVRDADDRPVAGSISVSEEETRWRYTPEAPWRAGSYRLVVGTELEDVAGNSIARPFEVDEVRPVTGRIVRETIALPFRVVPASR